MRDIIKRINRIKGEIILLEYEVMKLWEEKGHLLVVSKK